MNASRTFLLLLSLTVLGGCSSTFVYNQLDWLIPWYADNYVNLTRAQKKELKAALDPVLRWHREEELQTYVSIIDRVEADLLGPLDGVMVQGWADEAVAAWKRTERHMLDLTLDLGDKLSDTQMREFMESTWEQQEEYEAEYLPRTDAEYVEDNRESLWENMEELLGRLSDEQTARLDMASKSFLRFDRLWLQHRHLWLQQLEPLLQREPGWRERVETAIATEEEGWSAEYREVYRVNQDVISSAIADVLNLRSGKQNKRLLKALAGFRKDLLTLIEQAD